MGKIYILVLLTSLKRGDQMKLTNKPLSFFEKKFKCEKNSRVRERFHILLLLREGYAQREVSSMLHISKGKVPFWKKRFELEGINGLDDKVGRGVKSNMTDEQLSMLGSSLAEGYLMQNGYRRPYKTKDVVAFISTNFDIHYTIRHIRRILRRMGCTLNVPRPRHKKRNQVNVNKFKREYQKKR